MGGETWRWQMAILLIPTVVYGIILLGQKFPGAGARGGRRIVHGHAQGVRLGQRLHLRSFLLLAGINQVMVVTGIEPLSLKVQAGLAVIPAVVFGFYVKSFGRPMFVFLLLIMFLLATTEIGTDSWISDIMQLGAEEPEHGNHCSWSTRRRSCSSCGSLPARSCISFRRWACWLVRRRWRRGGLLWLANAGSGAFGMLFAAATFYGFGKTFFWPTTLGVVSEQYPKGGALMLNAIAGVGMLAVGVLGQPAIGTVQDRDFAHIIKERNPALAEQVLTQKEGMFGTSESLEQEKFDKLDGEQKEKVEQAVVESKQGTLAKIAVLPAIMFFCYLVLLFYFRSKGGYEAQVLTGHAANDEEYTGGVQAPVEA